MATLTSCLAVVAAMGPSRAALVLLVVAVLTRLGGWPSGLVGLFLLLTAMAHLEERSALGRRRRRREAVREILEALSESTRLEGDLPTQVLNGLERCTSDLARRLSEAVAGGEEVDAAFRREGEELRTLGNVLAHCRLSGTQPAFALSLLRQELIRRWRLAEETETAVGLMRAVATALAVALLAVTLVLTFSTAVFRGATGSLLLAFVLGTEAIAVLAPRAIVNRG